MTENSTQGQSDKRGTIGLAAMEIISEGETGENAVGHVETRLSISELITSLLFVSISDKC